MLDTIEQADTTAADQHAQIKAMGQQGTPTKIVLFCETTRRVNGHHVQAQKPVNYSTSTDVIN